MQLQPPWHHLVPFVASVTASFVWFVPRPTPSVGSMSLKCLPVILLAIHLFYLERWTRRESDYVFVALVLSALGDAFLVFHKHLALPGVVAFGMAQIAYTYAFGFRPVNWITGGVLYGIVIVALVVVFATVTVPDNYRKFIPVPILYAFLIVTMLWRALDRYQRKEDLSLERRLCTSIGAVIFVVSDLSIVFLQGARLIPQPYSKFVTMATYYAAQLLITLGTMEVFWVGRPADAATTAATSDLASVSAVSNPDDNTVSSSTDELRSAAILQRRRPSEASSICMPEESEVKNEHPEQLSSCSSSTPEASRKMNPTSEADERVADFITPSQNEETNPSPLTWRRKLLFFFKT